MRRFAATHLVALAAGLTSCCAMRQVSRATNQVTSANSTRASEGSGGGPRLATQPQEEDDRRARERAAIEADEATMQTEPHDARVAYWLGRLDEAETELSTAPRECRTVCRVTEELCAAAHELCVLTGDERRDPPADGRCVRARGLCDEASRELTSRCASCPSRD